MNRKKKFLDVSGYSASKQVVAVTGSMKSYQNIIQLDQAEAVHRYFMVQLRAKKPSAHLPGARVLTACSRVESQAENPV